MFVICPIYILYIAIVAYFHLIWTKKLPTEVLRTDWLNFEIVGRSTSTGGKVYGKGRIYLTTSGWLCYRAPWNLYPWKVKYCVNNRINNFFLKKGALVTNQTNLYNLHIAIFDRNGFGILLKSRNEKRYKWKIILSSVQFKYIIFTIVISNCVVWHLLIHYYQKFRHHCKYVVVFFFG